MNDVTMNGLITLDLCVSVITRPLLRALEDNAGDN